MSAAGVCKAWFLLCVAVLSLVLVKKRVQLRKFNLQRVCGDGDRTTTHIVVSLIDFSFHGVSPVDIFLGIFDLDDQHLLLLHFEDVSTYDF